MIKKIISSLLTITLVLVFFTTFTQRVFSEVLDVSKNHLLLSIMTDQDTNKLFKLNIEYDNANNIKRGQFENDIYTVEQFITNLREGLVLQKAKGIDVVILSSNNLSAENGGYIELTYLRNAILKTYSTFGMHLKKYNNKWALYNDDDEIINTLYIETKYFFGIPIGIKRIFENDF
ncbi:MAG: hypothetical protein HQK49_15185 [Oligoflexia bacterium]|nr:hypothetical protein [Oligoflexia bacterium]